MKPSLMICGEHVTAIVAMSVNALEIVKVVLTDMLSTNLCVGLGSQD